MPGPRTAELNGLNWQVQVDPLTLSMTSLPPTLPEFTVVEVDPDEVLDELLDELPPHAVTIMHTMATNAIHLKRFIDILRSRLDDRQLVAGSECEWLARRPTARDDGSSAAAVPTLS